MAGGATVTFVDVDGQGAIHHRQLRSAHGSTEKCTNKHESEPAHTISSCESGNCSTNIHQDGRSRLLVVSEANFLPPTRKAAIPAWEYFHPPPASVQSCAIQLRPSADPLYYAVPTHYPPP